jgi:hypothetical protein
VNVITVIGEQGLESFTYVGWIVVEMASYWDALGLVECTELIMAG